MAFVACQAQIDSISHSLTLLTSCVRRSLLAADIVAELHSQPVIFSDTFACSPQTVLLRNVDWNLATAFCFSMDWTWGQTLKIKVWLQINVCPSYVATHGNQRQKKNLFRTKIMNWSVRNGCWHQIVILLHQLHNMWCFQCETSCWLTLPCLSGSTTSWKMAHKDALVARVLNHKLFWVQFQKSSGETGVPKFEVFCQYCQYHQYYQPPSVMVQWQTVSRPTALTAMWREKNHRSVPTAAWCPDMSGAFLLLSLITQCQSSRRWSRRCGGKVGGVGGGGA